MKPTPPVSNTVFDIAATGDPPLGHTSVHSSAVPHATEYKFKKVCKVRNCISAREAT